MTAPVIVLDIDDVLTVTRDKVYEALKLATGRDIHWREWSEYDLRPRFELSHEEVMDVFNEHDIINQVTPEPDAKPFIDACKSAGYSVVALTARGWHPNAVEDTRAYFERYALAVDDVHVCTPAEDKADYIRHLGNVHLYVDDHLRHITQVLARTTNVGQCVLMDRPWNQTVEPIARAYRLNDCLVYL
ncbi:hypothetical protein ACKC9G_01855 [Pokkaliibacter sp. CJK22405]|uniref:hypothetical protein n=1 Tax=Pokkaliibacter sp. CJK22405 TaxID=3384615 RepID=UPI00398536CC